MSALPRHPELFGDMSHRTTITDHPLNEKTTAVQIQTSVSVSLNRPQQLEIP